MSSPVATDSADGVTVITMDDGKANALSFEMFAALNEALDRCSAAGDVALEERPVPDYYIVRAGADENSRVLEYSGSGGGPGPTIGANVPVKDVRPMTMPDGCRVAVVLTRSGLLSYLDLHALHLLPLPAVEVHGASRIYVPPWDSPRRSASGKR